MDLLALFRELLSLCRRQASRTSQCLFKLISRLARFIGFRRFSPQKSLPEEKTEVQDDPERKALSTYMATSSDFSPSRPAHEIAPPEGDCNADPSQSNVTEVTEDESSNRAQTTGERSSRESMKVPVKTSQPIAPSERPRYDRNITIGSNQVSWPLDPLGTYKLFKSLDRKGNLGTWKHYVHPEGIPYYLLDKSSSGPAFLTEADLTDDKVLEDVEKFMHELQTRIEGFGLNPRPGKIEVVLEIQYGWHYYMIDVERQIVFWIDQFDITHNLGQRYGVEKIDHFCSQLETEYWLHVEHFPNHRHIQPEKFDEAIGVVNHWKIDAITSVDSTAPYDLNDIAVLAESITNSQNMLKHQSDNAYAITSLARVMTVIWGERFLHFYGSPGARLNISQSVRGQPVEGRSWFIKCFAVLLFYSPYSYHMGLEKQWVDEVVQQRRWKEYRPKLESGWTSFILMSTVLLNANVALLTTPIVLSDNGDGNKLFASPAAVASQVSIIASLGSIIIGLILISQTRTVRALDESKAQEFVDYIGVRGHAKIALEILAILYSLPYALLMWGMVAFLVSIAISSFVVIDDWPSKATRAVYGFAWLLTLALIIWTVITNWEMSNKKHWKHLFSYDSITGLQRKWVEKNRWLKRMPGNATNDLESHELHSIPNVGPGAASTNDSPEATSMKPTDRLGWVRGIGLFRLPK